MSSKDTLSAFICSRISPTTFLIQEHNDIYNEHPFIYAKVIPTAQTIILIDTGCGGRTPNPDVEITHLRQFIETVSVDDNDGRPLNENGKYGYIVITTHCHYDHILAVEQFADSPILASNHSPSFLNPTNLPTHSLCKDLGIPTPKYTPTLVPHMHRITLNVNLTNTDLIILHTPGHTPDQLAIYDPSEKMLYVGDTLYESAPIIFPNEGSIIDWLASVDALIALVVTANKPGTGTDNDDALAQDNDTKKKIQVQVQVQINAGHETAAQPALDVLTAAKQFMLDVLEGREPVRRRFTKRGEENVVYEQDDGGRFSLVCPERLVKKASRRTHAD